MRQRRLLLPAAARGNGFHAVEVTNRGDDIRARFVVMCGGPLNKPKLPGIPGLRGFRGKVFHTARWDYIHRRRVARAGAEQAGRQAGRDRRHRRQRDQAVPYLARYAKQLYVLQRTPPTVDERPNPPTDRAWFDSLPPGWQAERQRNFHHGAVQGLAPGKPDLICDIWTEINRNLAAEFDREAWPSSPAAFMARREVMDFQVMERMRRRVASIVKDWATSEALKPWFAFNCKRPSSSNDYYPAFILPNVRLMDVSGTRGVERMTEHGFVDQAQEHAIDCLIAASGFEVTSDLDKRWGIATIAGRDGTSLYDHWADGYRTLHGTMTHRFPNLFFTGYLQGGFFATTTEQFSRQGFHIASIVTQALARGITAVEPTEQAQDDWVRTIREAAIDISHLQRECPPSYFNNDGDLSKKRWYLGESYGPGWEAFEQLIHDWRDRGDMEGMSLATTKAVTRVAPMPIEASN